MNRDRGVGSIRVDVLVRAHDPVGAASLQSERLDGALDALGASIVSRPGPAPQSRGSRWRWSPAPRGVFALAATTLTLAGGALAATRLFVNADTGRYPTTAWERRAGGPGEELKLAGTNFRQVALQASAGISYPPEYGAWRTWLITVADSTPYQSCPAGSAHSCTVEVSTGVLRGGFAQSAFCAWVYDWRAARTGGRSAEATRAVRVVDGALSWPAVRALDPHPNAKPPYTGPDRRGSKTIFGWMLPYRAAVRQGDLSMIDQLIAANYGGSGCASVAPPAGSRGGTVIPAGRDSR